MKCVAPQLIGSHLISFAAWSTSGIVCAPGRRIYRVSRFGGLLSLPISTMCRLRVQMQIAVVPEGAGALHAGPCKGVLRSPTSMTSPATVRVPCHDCTICHDSDVWHECVCQTIGADLARCGASVDLLWFTAHASTVVKVLILVVTGTAHPYACVIVEKGWGERGCCHLLIHGRGSGAKRLGLGMVCSRRLGGFFW